jgi:hypothetical protein
VTAWLSPTPPHKRKLIEMRYWAKIPVPFRPVRKWKSRLLFLKRVCSAPLFLYIDSQCVCR